LGGNGRANLLGITYGTLGTLAGGFDGKLHNPGKFTVLLEVLLGLLGPLRGYGIWTQRS